LHLGHAFSALQGWRAARAAGGRFLLRLEDIDSTRCRAEFASAISEDLHWLGLDWDGPVRQQSAHFADYAAALERLKADELLYPCFCTRAEIVAEIAGAASAPHGAAEAGALYGGRCRSLSAEARAARCDSGAPFALRLDLARATARVGRLRWHDRQAGWTEARPERFGDVVLARKDSPTSYHLAATLDDHVQGVSLVTRGLDLFEATHVHRLLQALLGLDSPDYAHHPLLTDQAGRRFAKRDQALTLAALRAAGVAPEALRHALETGRSAELVARFGAD
jgi:glutamyl-Q tRNA(Asp) synthetase